MRCRLELWRTSLVVGLGLVAGVGWAAQGVHVYQRIPGVQPSSRFSARVWDGSIWHQLFTMETVGPAVQATGIHAHGIYESVTGHSASWCTFEMDRPVTVEITAQGSAEIRQCLIRPLSRGLQPTISADGRRVRFDIHPRFADGRQVPVNVAVEINGQTEQTMSVFASPHIAGKPQPDDPGVLAVRPGTRPPTDGPWQTLYFLPGVHDWGTEPLVFRDGKNYYIPGDSWIDGSIGDSRREVDSVRVFGLGVLSGRRLGWFDVKNLGHGSRSVQIFGTNNTLEGVTIVDSPFHTIMAGSKNPAQPTLIRNVKLHNWRQNTDGIHFFGSGVAEDCFIHSQDDSHYVAGAADVVSFRRMVYWRDETFGVDIILTAGGGQRRFGASVTEDCDSIYNRSVFGGIHIDNRGLGKGEAIDGVIIRDVRIEDPGRNRPVVRFTLDPGPSTFRNIRLENITILTDNGHPFELFGGGPEAIIENVTFQDVKIGDRFIEDFSPRNFRLGFVRNLRIVRDGRVVATYSSDIEAESKALRSGSGNLLRNAGFELGEYGWTGGVAIGKQKVESFEGERCLAVMSSAGATWVIRQDLAFEITKHYGIPIDDSGEWTLRKALAALPQDFQPRSAAYALTAWMRIDEGHATGQVGFQYTLSNMRREPRQERGKSLGAEVPLVPGQWVKVSAVVRIPWDFHRHDWLRTCFFVSSAKGKFGNLYIDGCNVVPVEP